MLVSLVIILAVPSLSPVNMTVCVMPLAFNVCNAETVLADLLNVYWARGLIAFLPLLAGIVTAVRLDETLNK